MHNSQLCYIGLGSNLDDPVKQLHLAIETLAKLSNCSLLKQSSFYHSKAMADEPQPDYVNAVVALLTHLSPQQLMQQLLAIEVSQGRVRTAQRWQARTLDLDMLLYGNLVLQETQLTLPHYGLKQRAFVLIPLFEIAPDLILPDGTKLAELVKALKPEEVITYET